MKNHLDESLKDNLKEIKNLQVMQVFFTIATFAIYFSFVAVIFAGVSIWGLQEYLLSKDTTALLWTIVVIISTPIALSLGKHNNYHSIAKAVVKRDAKGAMLSAFYTLAIVSGIYYEAISSSSNLQAKSFNAVDYKGNLAAIMSSQSLTSGSGKGLSLELAKAETKLAQCKELLAMGKEPHCKGAKAAVDSLKNQINMDAKLTAESSANAIKVKSEALQKAVDNQALPAAKWIAEILNISYDGGTMLIVIIAALFFELIHITTVFTEIQCLKDREYLKSRLDEIKDNAEKGFYHEEIRTRGKPYVYKEEQGFGFVPNAKFKWEDSTPSPTPSFGFGFIPNRDSVKHSQESVEQEKSNKNNDYTDKRVGTRTSNTDNRVGTRTSNTDNRVGTRTSNTDNRVGTRLDNPQWSGREGHCKWCDAPLNNDRKLFCNREHKDNYWNWHKPPITLEQRRSKRSKR